MKVFKVATGKVVAVCEVKGKMVCWNNSGNKLAVVTNADKEVGKGRRVVYFDIQVSPIPPYLQHLTLHVTIFFLSPSAAPMPPLNEKITKLGNSSLFQKNIIGHN